MEPRRPTETHRLLAAAPPDAHTPLPCSRAVLPATADVAPTPPHTEHENADEDDAVESHGREVVLLGASPRRSEQGPEWRVHLDVRRHGAYTSTYGGLRQSSDPRVHGSRRRHRPRAQIQPPPPPTRWNPSAAAARVPGSGLDERRWTGVWVTCPRATERGDETMSSGSRREASVGFGRREAPVGRSRLFFRVRAYWFFSRP